jgi:hypothetical protein
MRLWLEAMVLASATLVRVSIVVLFRDEAVCDAEMLRTSFKEVTYAWTFRVIAKIRERNAISAGRIWRD